MTRLRLQSSGKALKRGGSSPHTLLESGFWGRLGLLSGLGKGSSLHGSFKLQQTSMLHDFIACRASASEPLATYIFRTHARHSPTCPWIQRSASLHLEGFQLFTGVPLEAASPLEPGVIDTETHQFENP
jgi:hypothetical protein